MSFISIRGTSKPLIKLDVSEQLVAKILQPNFMKFRIQPNEMGEIKSNTKVVAKLKIRWCVKSLYNT